MPVRRMAPWEDACSREPGICSRSSCQSAAWFYGKTGAPESQVSAVDPRASPLHGSMGRRVLQGARYLQQILVAVRCMAPWEDGCSRELGICNRSSCQSAAWLHGKTGAPGSQVSAVDPRASPLHCSMGRRVLQGARYLQYILLPVRCMAPWEDGCSREPGICSRSSCQSAAWLHGKTGAPGSQVSAVNPRASPLHGSMGRRVPQGARYLQQILVPVHCIAPWEDGCSRGPGICSTSSCQSAAWLHGKTGAPGSHVSAVDPRASPLHGSMGRRVLQGARYL